tara:strand:+ start:6442 stop:8286 length:1845 start_codon:yes stop_codon:yes gene_type:complete
MALVKYQFRPGINKELTSYANEGGWLDSDKIRFRYGKPEKIGGWSKNSTNSFLGTCRALHTYKTSTLASYNALGTHLKWYVQEGNSFYDITPVDNTTAAGDVTFTATSGSTTLTVNDTSHNANPGDFVIFSGAATVGGNVTATVLNQEYQIQSTTTNTYTITLAQASNHSGSGGGSNTVGTYLYGSGLDVFVSGSGWGAGAWGSGTWGSTSPVAVFSQLRLWSIDNFGEDLVAVPRGGPLFVWQVANGVATRAVLASSVAGASNCPISAFQIMTSDVDRHLIALGCNPIGSSTVDPLFVRWSDSENMFDWTPSATNSAGGVKLSSGSQIIGAVQTRQETLVFTDASVFSMRFVGSPFYFSFNEIARGIGMISPKAGVAVGGQVFFMDDGAFYRATGNIERINCTVLDYIFSNINKSQRFKIFAGHNQTHNEVIWFYPSASSNEIDRYVTYNYAEKVWSVGTTADNFTRTAWNQAPLLDFPLATGKLDNTNNNYIYNHETGNTADGTAFNAYIESADIDLDPDGESFMFVNKVIPDIEFLGSSNSNDTVNLTLKGRRYPAETRSTLSTIALTPSTQFTNTRGRTRQVSVRIENNGGDFGWRLGDSRFDIKTDGRK